MNTGKLFSLLGLLIAGSLTAADIVEYKPADGKPYLAGDLPENLPQLQLPADKFDGSEFTIAAWVVPGSAAKKNGKTIPDNTYCGIAFKGDRGVSSVDFSFQLFGMVPNFSLINPGSRMFEGVMRFHDKLRTGKYGTRLVLLKDCLKAEPFRWNHIAATFDNGKITTYVNGRISAEGTSRVKKFPLSETDVQIGCGQGEGGTVAFFNGYIGKISFCNKALSPADIESKYLAEKGDYPADEIDVPSRRAALFADYSPDFKNKLELTGKFEKNIPAPLREANSSFSVVMHKGAPAIQHNGKIMPVMTVAVTPKDSDEKVNSSLRDFAAAGMPVQSLMIQNLEICIKRGMV